MIEPAHVQTKKEIEAALASADVRPLKRFGQNFLIDGNLMRRLADCAEIQPADRVLEVGPGTGGLTDLLADRAAYVVCVEIDRTLAGIVRDRFADRPHVRIIEGDVLHGKHHLNPEVAAVLAENPSGGGAWKLVANLPYQAATPLVMNLLTDYPQVRRLCFTVQAEVADRITADPGGRDFGPLSIVVQMLSTVHVVARLGPHLFWPRPKVDSAMLRLDVHDPPPALAGCVRAFSEFVRAVFDHRRKTLRSALGFVIDDAARDRVCACVDASRRPETFGREEWLMMFETVEGMKN